MEWTYAVTWESATAPPLTYRGAISASTYQSAVGKAIRGAGKQKKEKSRFSSIIVIIEKAIKDDEPEPEGV